MLIFVIFNLHIRAGTSASNIYFAYILKTPGSESHGQVK